MNGKQNKPTYPTHRGLRQKNRHNSPRHLQAPLLNVSQEKQGLLPFLRRDPPSARWVQSPWHSNIILHVWIFEDNQNQPIKYFLTNNSNIIEGIYYIHHQHQ
jgi:hypothetical protein